MPELPEVETIVRGLRKTIVGKTIVNFDDRDSKVVQIEKSDIVGARVHDIERRAKIIIMRLDNDTNLIFHMKMTGQLIWESRQGGAEFSLRNRRGGGHPDKAWLEKLPNKHTRAIFTFDDKSVLYFNDIRRFGYIKSIINPVINESFLRHPALDAGSIRNKIDSRWSLPRTPIRGGNDKVVESLLDNLGVEPLGEDLTVEYLQKIAKRFPNRKVKQFIMDQSIVAGVGNIYADESLFEAKIAPMRLVKDVKKGEGDKLIKSIKKILKRGIKYGGSSSENFVDAFGQQGRAHEYLKVYRKTGEKCPENCGGVITRTVIGGRGTHWCPKCQK